MLRTNCEVSLLYRGNLKTETTLNTNLVVASLCNVSYPSIGVVSRLVVYTKETNVDSAGGEHRHLKFNIDRRTTPRFGSNRGHEVNFGANMAFGLSSKALDTPNNRLLFWFVLGSTKGMLNLGLGRVFGYGHLENNVSGVQLIREIGNHLQVNRNPEGKIS
jgi:hypothetical protein